MRPRTFTVVDDDSNFKATVVIAQEPAILTDVRLMVQFWSNWESKLDDNDGDYCKTFAQQIGERLISISTEYSPEGAVDFLGNQEGYCVLDGSSGVTVTIKSAFEYPGINVQEQWLPPVREKAK